MKHMKRLCALFLSLVLTLSLVAPAVPAAQAAESGTTYYVSTLHGSDGNNGTSEAMAFYSLSKINNIQLQPGDKVLLERGSVFENEYLHVKGSGAEGSPIVIDAYGIGEKPLINTNGNGVWYQNYGTPLDNVKHVWRGYVSSCILLFDVEYIEVNNIAMTNWGGVDDGATVPGELGFMASSPAAGSYSWAFKMERTGVAVVTQDIGTADHIYLKDLDIENIYGNVYDKHMNNGGIYFTVAKPHNESGENGTGISRFNDVLIEGNYISRTSRWGIAAAYTAYHAQFNPMAISDAVCEQYGATNMIIRNNFLEDVGGDPITTMYAFEPLIEYNVSNRGGRETLNRYFNDSRHTNQGKVSAGIWPWKCKTALFQYNECYNMTGPQVGNGDGQAWDADSGDSTIYQYNYSSGNAGGCVMACLQQAYNTVFRYNISYKDGEGTGVLNTCDAPNGKYYNNTFIVAETAKILRDGMMGGNPVLENNIFYGLGAARNGNWNEGTPGAVYDNNLYYNFSNKPASDSKAVQVAAGTGVFAAAPVGPTEPLTTKGVHGWTHDWETAFESFELKSDSPAINAGMNIDLSRGLGSDHGVNAATKDFYGTALDASHDIGAHDTATPDLKLASAVYTVNQTAKTIAKVPTGITVADFLQNVTIDTGVTAQVKKNDTVLDGAAIVDMDCVVVLTHNGVDVTYTFVKDTDKDIKTSVFELGKNKTTGALTYIINVPFGDDFPVSVSDFLAGVTVASTATAKVYSGAAEVTGGNVADGMTLKITAQDESTQDYTIKQKNVYNHSTDWINKPVQGNVWYAQTRVNNSYSNMTGWDSTYHCFSGNGYAAVEHYCITGDITINSAQASTSMAFRAPLTGTVEVSFGASGSDVGANEIKFRNTNANGADGVVKMLITKNGVTLPDHAYVLSKAAATPITPFVITLEKGDMLRFEAQNTGSTPSAGFSMVPIVTYRQPERDTQAPTVPEGLYHEIGSDNKVTVHWSPATDNVGVTGYLVSLDSAEAVTVTECSVAYPSVSVGEHTLTVKAVDAAGNESTAANYPFTVSETADTTPPTQPGKPVVKDAASLTMNTIGITWEPSTDEVGVSRYEVHVDGVKHGDATTSSYTITGLAPKTTYAVTVYAKDAAGNTSDVSEAENITTVAKKIKIACVGDSITQGNQYNIRAGYDYPSRLGDLLGDQYEVKNFGKSGATMVAVWGGTTFIERAESKACVAYEPDVIVFMLGTNDGHPDAWNGSNARTQYAVLAQTLIDTYKAIPSNPQIIFATSPTATKGTYYGQNVDIINNELAAIQRQVAKDNGCTLLDMNALTREFFASGLMTRYAPVEGIIRDDRIHPNEDGYYEMAKLVKQGVDELMRTGDGKNHALVDDRSGAITYTGTWTNTDGDPTLYKETSKITHTEGDTASFTFTGDSIRVVGEIYGVLGGENFGYADVTIDGSPAGMATFLYNKDDPELTRTNCLKKEIVFEKTGLGAGSHTITLTARTLKTGAPGAGNCGISLDGFFVGGAVDTGALKSGLTDAKLAYAGAVKAGDNSPAAGALLAAINLATMQLDTVATQTDANTQADAINAAVAAYARTKTASTYAITVTPPRRGSAKLTLANGSAATMPVVAGTKLKLTVSAGEGNQARSILFGDTKLNPLPKRDGSITVVFTATCDMTVAPTVDSRTIRVACVGDSITHGACSSHPQINGYPAQLQALLGDGYTVGNFAMSSACARDDGNFPYEAQSVSIQSKNFLPDVVVIMLGTNDASSNNWTGYGADGFKTDVAALVNTYRALPSQPEVFLATAPFSHNATFETPIHNAVAPATREAATTLGCTLIDMHAGTENLDRKYFDGDGIHFNDAGYTLMANLMYAGLKGETNRPALETLYNRCKDIAQFQCDASGWAAFDEARTAAKAVLDKTDATGMDIEIARLALADAEKALTVVAPTKVICVGDSITYGARADPRETWNYPTQLQGMLGKGYVVENYGVNGRTVNDTKEERYTATAQFTASKNSKPDIVILMMGTNDSKNKNWDGVEQFKTSATSLINVYKNLSTRPAVYLATSPAVRADEASFTDSAEEIIRNSRIKADIAPAQRALATALGCTLIDVNEKTNAMADAGTLETDFLHSDGIHPHNAGYTILAGYMFEGLSQGDAGPRPKVTPTVLELNGLDLLVPVAAQITVAQLKADLIVGAGVTLTVTTAAGTAVADTAAVAAGMKVVATAGAQHTDYTVVARNAYNHYDEFVGNRQGPIWFYERKLKSNNTYQKFTDWNSGGWWGGEDPDYSSAERVGACGDIRAEASRAYTSSAISYQAPADGTVSINFAAPPTFRAASSSGNAGTVHLVITQNGTTIQGQDYQIPAYDTGLVVEPFTVALRKGDWLRFEIVNRGGAISGNGGVAMNPVVTYTVPDNEDPTAPTGLAVAGVTKTSADLTWTASTDDNGVTKYVVTYGPTDGVSATKDVTTNRCALTGLTEGTEYTVKVTAYDAAGNSTDSTPITFRTKADDEQAPTIPGNLAAAAGDLTETTAKLTWTASTDTVGVTGYKVYLGDTFKEEVTDLTYTLTGLNAWTEYTAKVSAVDAAGNESVKAEVTFKTKDTTVPDAPTGVAAGTVTKNSAVISWTAPNDNVAVTGYEISDGTRTIPVDNVTTYTLSGLTAGSTYTVSVVALDAAGNKSVAGTVEVTTEVSEDTTPPAIPQNVSVSRETATGATVTWDAVDDADSDLDGYTVYWTDGTTSKSATVAAGVETYDITGLKDLTDYTVTVKAYDTSGNHSAASGEAAFTTLDGTAPTVPSDVTATADDHESVTVTWSASTDNSGTVAKYVVTLKEGENVVGVPTDVTDGTTISFTELVESTAYTVSVVAVDAAENTSAAGTASVTTPAAPDTEPPTKPANVTAYGVTLTTATITWDAGTDNVGVVKHTVTYGPTGGETTAVDVTGATSHKLRELTAGTEYTVVVAAYDAAGNHSESDPVVFETQTLPPVPDTEAPGVPGGLTVSGVTTTGAVLSWTAATDNVGVVKYLIYNSETLVEETAATTYTLTGLTAGSSYTFKVIAVDASENQSDPAQVSFATQTESSGPPPSTGGTGGSSSGSTTEKNEDGSTTTTETDKKTGTVTQTTKRPDGSKTVVETKKDGTVTTSDARKDGVKVETVTTPDKETTAAVTVPEHLGKTTVRVPAPAVTSGTVAVLVKEDGTEEIVKLSVALNGDMVFPVEGSAQIKLIDNSKGFSDVVENSYYRSAVDFVTARELFQGVGAEKFAPELTLDRGMLVTVLYRLSSGQDLTTAIEAGKISFADVQNGAWYAEAVDWAVKNDVTSGTGAGFAPQAELSREQLAVFLYNYAGKPQTEETYRFIDSGKISPWAEQAMSWAIANGILTAGDDSRVNPDGSASRGDTAMMLQNFVKYLAG